MPESDEALERLNRLAEERFKNRRNGLYALNDFVPFMEATPYLLSTFRQSDRALRAQISAALTVHAKSQLNVYGMKMAELAVRHQSSAMIVDGLTAMAIESGEGADSRDSTVTLALLYNSALKLGVDASKAFADAADLSVSGFERVIRRFPFRDDRELNNWNVREKTTEDGFTYG